VTCGIPGTKPARLPTTTSRIGYGTASTRDSALAAATSTSRNRVATWTVAIGYRVRARWRRSCASTQRLRSSSVAHSRRGTGTGRRSSSIATIVK